MKKEFVVILLAVLILFQINFTNGSSLNQQDSNNITKEFITMQNTIYFPTSINVTVNEIVNFTIVNNDPFSHTFTISNTSNWRDPAEYTVKGAPPFDYTINGSSSISFIYQFPSTPQIIKYYCRFHSIMNGYIYVNLPVTTTSKMKTSPFDSSSFLFTILGLTLDVTIKRNSKLN